MSEKYEHARKLSKDELDQVVGGVRGIDTAGDCLNAAVRSGPGKEHATREFHEYRTDTQMVDDRNWNDAS